MAGQVVIAPAGFTLQTATIDGVETRWMDGGIAGRVVVLLHGFPATGYSWRHVAVELAKSHRVIVPDLRGVGVERVPPNGYDKRAMARGLASLLDRLKVGSAALVGHDMGALIAYAFARLFPERATHLVFVDQILAGFGLEAMMDFSKPGRKLWHFVFHQQPDMPEMLITGREAAYLEYFWKDASDPSVISDEERALYTEAYMGPALTAGLNLYRAVLADGEANRADASPKLTLPTLAIGGETATGPIVAQSLREVVARVEEWVVEGCGHWPQLESPDEMSRRIAAFLERPSALGD